MDSALRLGRLAMATLLLAGASSVRAADWPQFRGSGQDGRSAETGLLDRWPAEGPKVVWRVPLGEGFSAVSIVDGRLYTMFASGSDEFVGSFDAATGKEIWRVKVGAKWKDRFGNGPRSTPTVDGKVVYGLGSKGNLVALDAKDGKVIWQRDLKADFGARVPQWGVSTSPLIHGPRLLLDVGGSDGNARIALDKTNGEVLWRAGSDAAGYATPLALTVAGVEQVLFFTAAGLVSVNPGDGTELWRHPWKTSYDVNAATPVFVAPDKVFVSSGYDVGAALLRIKTIDGKPAVELVWSSREMKNQFSSSVLHDGHLYGFDDKTLKCLDVTTGEMKWRKREFGHGSLILAGDALIVLSDKGALALVEARPGDYVERGNMQAFSGKTWTMPSLSDGRLYLRDESEMMALDLMNPRAGSGKQDEKQKTNGRKGE